jgi:hypothetical protein
MFPFIVNNLQARSEQGPSSRGNLTTFTLFRVSPSSIIFEPDIALAPAPISAGIEFRTTLYHSFPKEHYPFISPGVQKGQDGILSFRIFHIGET